MTGGTWRVSVGSTLTGTKSFPGAAQSIPYSYTPTPVAQALNFGTGAGLASVQVAELRSLAAGASETLNLFDGTLLDIFGDPATFRVLRGLKIYVASGGDTGGVTVGNAGSNPSPLFFGAGTHTQTIYPSGPPMLGGGDAGVTVTASACNLKVVNNGAVAVTYGIELAGTAGQPGSPIGLGGLLLTYP